MRAESGPSGPSGIAPFCVLGAEERNRVTEHCTCMKSHFYLGRLCAVGRWIGEMERTHCPSPVADHTFTTDRTHEGPGAGGAFRLFGPFAPRSAAHTHTGQRTRSMHITSILCRYSAPRVRRLRRRAATRTSTPPWRLALVDIRTRSAYRHSPTHSTHSPRMEAHGHARRPDLGPRRIVESREGAVYQRHRTQETGHSLLSLLFTLFTL